MIDLAPDANEILPRLWVGNAAACEKAGPSWARVCVLEGAHAAGCEHIRILQNQDQNETRANPEWLTQAAKWIWESWRFARSPVLVHCAAGVERSPLTVAWFLAIYFRLSFDESYALIRKNRAIVEDRTGWLHGASPIVGDH